MKRILIYVSDHHHGHATRMVALARGLIKTGDFEVVIKNSNAFSFLKRALPGARVKKVRTDVGPTFDWNSNKIDPEITFENYSSWIQTTDDWILKEFESFKEQPADLIVTDISPMALRLSEKVKCPSVTVTNFSWIDILKRVDYHEEKKNVIKWLNESFSLSDLAIKLPFSTELEGFLKVEEASLLCRETTFTKEQTLKKFQLNSPLVVVTFGNQIPPKLKINNTNNDVQVVILSPNRTNSGDIRTIQDYSETQNIVASADLVITKGGYSTTAECAKFRCPMYMVIRENYHEEIVLSRAAANLGLAKILDMHSSSSCIDVPDEKQIKDMKSNIKESSIASLEKLTSPIKIIQELVK